MPFLSPEDETYLRDTFQQHMVKDVTISLFTQRVPSLLIPGYEREAQFCAEANEIIEVVAALCEKIHLDVYDYRTDTDKVREYGVQRVPAVLLGMEGRISARFLGVPSGYEFSTLVQDILDLSTDTIDLSADTQDFLQNLEEDLHFQVFVTPT